MEEIKYKYFAWSYDKAYLDDIVEEMEKRGFSCICESTLGRYLLSVPECNYLNALEIVREIGDELRIGTINFYDKFRPLKSYSLAYAYVEDAKNLNENWEDEYSQPKNIKKMIKELKDICDCDVLLIVNLEDSAVEILITENINNRARIKEGVCNFLSDNNFVKFKEVYACYPDGEFIKPTPEEKLKIEGVYRIFDSSFLACGMYRFKKNSLVYQNDDDRDLFWKGFIGFTDDTKFFEEYTEDKIVIMGETKLYETRLYNSAGESISFDQQNLLSFETKLEDNLDYNSTIILSGNRVIKITTKYKDSRKFNSTRKLPFGDKFPSDTSIRDVFLPFPKESGEYEGSIEEYYMRSTDGTKLLHFATHTPYFEIYDIPEDFDFINNNDVLKKSPSVYDIRDYNPEEPKLASVKDLINNAIKKLELKTTNDNNNH